MAPRDYDTTLARIAGNIAGQLCGQQPGKEQRRKAVRYAMEMAKDIVAACREDASPIVKEQQP